MIHPIYVILDTVMWIDHAIKFLSKKENFIGMEMVLEYTS